MSEQVEVARMPRCDFCGDQPNRKLARYDGKTLGGPWANMCQAHFNLHGIGLGTGKGQRLVLRVEEE